MSEVKKFIVDGKVINVPTVDETTVNQLIDNKVYNWARQPEKPEYTAEEVGALPQSTTIPEYHEGTNIRIDGDQISAKGYVYNDSINSFAEGINSTASGQNSHSEGNNTTVIGNSAHVEGDWDLNRQTTFNCQVTYFSDEGIGGYSNCDESINYSVDAWHCSQNESLHILINNIEMYTSVDDFVGASLEMNGETYIIQSYLQDLFDYDTFSNSNSITWGQEDDPDSVFFPQYIGKIYPNNRPNTDFLLLREVKLTLNGESVNFHGQNIDNVSATITLSDEKRGKVNGQAAHAEGGAQVIYSTGGHAEGVNNVVGGDYAHAEGAFNKVIGAYSHVEGTENIVEGIASHASGTQNVVKGDNAFAFGIGLIANNGQTVIGKFNEELSSNYIFIVGNGTDEFHRSNAFYVKRNGDYGN